jgi:hypothetical protein
MKHDSMDIRIWGIRGTDPAFLNLALDEGEWSAPGRLALPLWKEETVCLHQSRSGSSESNKNACPCRESNSGR